MTRESGDPTLPEIVEIVDGVTDAQAARAAGVLAGFAVGLRLPDDRPATEEEIAGLRAEMRAALEYLGLGGVSPDRKARKTLTVWLDIEVLRRLRRTRRMRGNAA